ncbi:MAG: EAL domain-containing protein [Saprospiraceae bacterium]|nr:EAL domain-containing protein [Pyrinomonadaceae bacterium]
MNYQRLTKFYMIVVLLLGLACILAAAVGLPLEKFDLKFVVLACFTVGIGSRVTLQIPRFKSHIAVSDTFIFLALLMYGAEFAIILSAVEAYFSSIRFCSKKLTIFFNAAAMAFSTTAVVLMLKVFGLYSESQLHGHGEHIQDFVIALSIMALTHFIVNTSLVSTYESLSNGIPFWDTWKNKYLWTFITYFVGAASAGLLIQLSDSIGFGVIIATFPVVLFIFLSYRMYLKNVEMSNAQADQAKEYSKVLEERSAALIESEQRFRSAFNYAPIGIALVSPAGDWLRVNHALCKLVGYTAEELRATNFQSIIFPEDLGPALVNIHELLSGKTANCQMEQRYRHKGGETVWALWSVSAASDVRSEKPTLIFQLQDISDKKLAEDKLHYEATHDALTGLPNRSFFMRKLAKALQKTKLDPKYKVSVLFIDLDRFKYVNDSLGHLVGDQLLIAIAERLRECMRPPDIVARLGGDEFTILVEGRYYMEKVTRIAERIHAKFGVPFEVRGHEVYSSASIGILHASEKHLTSEEMMRDADTAMYHAKRAGKARHEVFDEDMHVAARETLRLETDLRRAIEKEEFLVLYQPIFLLETGEIKGIEALARWNHLQLGEISPNKFIPLAEEVGLIDVLGEHILRKACTQIGSVLPLLKGESALKLSVNLSFKQFARPTLVEKIQTILDETEFPPNRLKLEITESVFFEYQEKAVGMLHRLRDIGIELDVDDFGTGYSNLSNLMRLPISTLKIDSSFIKPINDGGANTEMVKSILAMARNLGLKVIAEGIENEIQLEVLKKLDCEHGQGFLLAKPMPFEAIREFLLESDRIDVPKPQFDDLSTVSLIQ